MPRRSTCLTALSAALCLVTLVAWAHSYRRCDVLLSTDHPGNRLTITSEFGTLVFEIEWPHPANVQPGWSYFTNSLPRRYGQKSHLGFAAYTSSARHYLLLPPTELWGITIPHGFAFLLTAIAPCMWLGGRSARALALQAGRCQQCGYDLRATPHRCPECGKIAERAAPAITAMD